MSTRICGRMRIGDGWVDARSGKTRQVINPYDREVIGDILLILKPDDFYSTSHR